MAFTPGNAALTAVELGLAASDAGAGGLDVRPDAPRTSAARGRWLLTPVVAVLGLARVGATYENVILVRDQDTYPAPGTSYEVGGHRLHLDCRGHGGPTVVLFNGLGEVSASWARIADEVGRTTRVCAYDRAGQGWSQDSRAAPRTA